MKINPVTAESYQAEGRTERHAVANSRFRILRNHQKGT